MGKRKPGNGSTYLCAQRVPTAPGRLARVHGPRHHLQARAQKLLNHRASEATVRRVHLPENSRLARALVAQESVSVLVQAAVAEGKPWNECRIEDPYAEV